MTEIECVIDSRSLLGEATCWDAAEKVLWWIDIWAPAINRFDPATGANRSWPAPEYLGTISVRAKGGLVVTMVSGFYFFDPASGAFEAIADPESEIADSRFNDGKTDRQGRFWSGSMFEAPDKPPAKIGALWRLDRDLTLHKIIDGIGCANGLAWSPDSRTMYFTDSHENVVRAYDFDPTSGDVENQRIFIDLSDEGFIVDGATVDADGNYWMTIPFNGKLRALRSGRQDGHQHRHADGHPDLLRVRRSQPRYAFRHVGDAASRPPGSGGSAKRRRRVRDPGTGRERHSCKAFRRVIVRLHRPPVTGGDRWATASQYTTLPSR